MQTHTPAASPAQAPPPAALSRRYFVLLYTPRAHRAGLATLLALGDELRAGSLSPEHAVAHVRLEWWRMEAERWARGEPQHPWLRTLLGETREQRWDLHALVEAAALDLAHDTLGEGSEQRLASELFVQAARFLGAAELSAEAHAALASLGRQVHSLERARAMPQDTLTALTALQEAVEKLTPAQRRAAAPLLVWTALTARHGRRNAARFDVLADNFLAWSTARRAARGSFRLKR